MARAGITGRGDPRRRPRPLGGTLARLTVDEHGTAVGPFVPHWAGFMTMRHEVEQAESFRPWVAEPFTECVTSIDPAPLAAPGLFGFVVQWHLPEVTLGRTLDDDGQPVVVLIAMTVPAPRSP